MPRHEAKTIVEDDQFTEELKALIPNAKRADEFIDGAILTLACNCTQGTMILRSPPLYFLPINESPTVTPVVLYYTFDDKRVIFLAIKKAILE